LTTALEGLSKRKGGRCRSWKMNGMRKAPRQTKEKVGISFFQPAHFDLHLYPCIRNSQTFLSHQKIPADIKRTMGVQAFMMVGYIGKDEDPHSTM